MSIIYFLLCFYLFFIDLFIDLNIRTNDVITPTATYVIETTKLVNKISWVSGNN